MGGIAISSSVIDTRSMIQNQIRTVMCHYSMVGAEASCWGPITCASGGGSYAITVCLGGVGVRLGHKLLLPARVGCWWVMDVK